MIFISILDLHGSFLPNNLEPIQTMLKAWFILLENFIRKIYCWFGLQKAGLRSLYNVLSSTFWFCLLWLNDFYPFLSHSSSLIFGIDWAKEISSALIAHVTKLFSQLPENNFSFTLGPTSVFCYIFSSEVADTKCFWVAAHRSCFYLMLLDFCSRCSKWLKTFGPPYLSCRNSPQTLSTKSAALNYCWGSELL